MEISAFIRTSFIDYPGNISAVLFTKGCNMSCPYCHNKGIDNSNNKIKLNEVLNYLYKRKRLLDAVTISGGEPTLYNELYDFCNEVKLLGYKVKIDTNGSNPLLLRKLLNDKLVDYVAMDIKSSPNNYKKICGLSFDDVKESFNLVKNMDDYEFRTTLYPKINKKDILDIIHLLDKKNYFIQQYRKTEFCDIEPYNDTLVKNFCSELNIKYRGIN